MVMLKYGGMACALLVLWAAIADVLQNAQSRMLMSGQEVTLWARLSEYLRQGGYPDGVVGDHTPLGRHPRIG